MTNFKFKSTTVVGQGSSENVAGYQDRTLTTAQSGEDTPNTSLVLAAARNTWQDDAACHGYEGPADWFANETDQLDALGAAITICNRCPVRVECAEHALSAGETEGVWGGLTASQRARIDRGLPAREHFPTNRCGTPLAKRRHRLSGETCRYCDGTTRAGPCGTRRGHRRHKAEGQRPCWSCVEAERFYQRNRPDRRAGAGREAS